MINRRSSNICVRLSANISLRLVLVIICCLCISIGSFVDAVKLRLCIVESSHTTKKINKICPRLKENDGSAIECVVVNDRINCLRRLSSGDAEFAILEPEDLVLAGENTEHDILVTHELRLFKNDTQRFAMVALVSKDIRSASDLMGKSFCHSGFENTEDSTRIYATYFQNWIIPRKCDRDKTFVEDEISSLAEFFGSACIPGAWTSDSTYDNYLKSKYRNLCALCDNPAGCYNSDKYHGREGALLCLTENAADVAWVRLEDALQHFKALEINETNYSYLCPDGTTRSMDGGRPCVWMRRPWPVIVASRSNAENVAKVVDSIGRREFSWQTDVSQLMGSYRVTPVTTETLSTPDDFIRRYAGLATANTRRGCTPSRSIRWCVASNLEDRKCRSLKDVAQAYGIEPPISCIQQPHRTACLDAIRTGRLDIFVAKPEEELEAKLKGLRSLIRAVTNKKQDMKVFAALVKNDSRYRTLDDLKGARACFTGYRSIGWNAFVDAMANNKNDQIWNCSDIRAVSSFFKDSCVPRIVDSGLKHQVPFNLYSLCQNGDETNSTAAAYACLNSGRGDVAFVSLEDGLNSKRGTILDKNFRSIRIDSSGTNEESSCTLTWSELATVMTNENITELRREEIYSTLLEIDVLFGKNFPGQVPALSLYGPYDSVRNIIFPEQTQHLAKEASHVRLPRHYAEVVERLVSRDRAYSYCSRANRQTETLHGALAIIMTFVTIFFFSLS